MPESRVATGYCQVLPLELYTPYDWERNAVGPMYAQKDYPMPSSDA